MTGDNTQKRFDRLLSKEESARAANFVRTKDKERFTIFHGTLRIILGWYTNTPPELLEFEIDRFGKPEIKNGGEHSSMQFSLTHSNDLALIAVTRSRKIGIDVEFFRPIMDAKDIIRNYFSISDQRCLFSKPKSQFETSFYACWTQKEALAKAIGKGLFIPLDKLKVPLEKILARTKNERSKEASWTSENWVFRQLAPHEKYVGALVSERYSSLVKYVFNYSLIY